MLWQVLWKHQTSLCGEHCLAERCCMIATISCLPPMMVPSERSMETCATLPMMGTVTTTQVIAAHLQLFLKSFHNLECASSVASSTGAQLEASFANLGATTTCSGRCACMLMLSSSTGCSMAGHTLSLAKASNMICMCTNTG